MLVLLCISSFSVQAADDALWQALKRGGHVALIRHALAPGTGDPPGFRLGACETQRNLSEEGRLQARAIGDRFRQHGVTNVIVYSSQWCRCVDTATELGLGPVKLHPALNSFFQDSSTGPAQTAAVRTLIREQSRGQTLVLVTHQVNITALTKIHPASAELIVLRVEGDAIEVAGRIR